MRDTLEIFIGKAVYHHHVDIKKVVVATGVLILVVATGVLILAALQRTRTIVTDHQGLMKQLTDDQRLRRTSLLAPAAPPLRMEALRSHHILLRWHWSHGERRNKNRSGWSREAWDIFKAHQYAAPRRVPAFRDLPVPILKKHIGGGEAA